MILALNNQDITGLVENRSITLEDPIESPNRRLKFKLKRDNARQVANFLGQTATISVNGSTWFEGVVMVKGRDTTGRIQYTANDPAFYLGKNPGDYVYQQQAGEAIVQNLAEACGVAVGWMDPTGVVFPQLLYRGKYPDKIVLDVIARLVQNGKKFWYRYQPGVGLVFFERGIPTLAWVFEIGVNLTNASYEETIEAQITRATLVNRETGEVITREATEKLHPGNVTNFEETDKTGAEMAGIVDSKLAKLSQVGTTMRIEGVNPGVMPMFWAGDAVYIHEPETNIVGGYYLKNVTQTIISDNLVILGADVIKARDIPEIQYEDATEAAKEKAAATSGSSGGSGSSKKTSVIERYF